MADVIKSIRASGGDYSTIAAWQADLDDGAVYNAGDHAIGELYDSSYAEQASVDNGNTLGLSQVTLRAHSSARHSGRSGTGVRVICQGFNPFWGASLSSTPTYNFEWFEYDGNGMDDSEIIALQSGSTTRCRNLIVHNAVHTSATFNCYGIRCRGSSDNHEIDNCLVYNVEQTGGQRITGILLENTTTGKVRNCTVTDIRETNVTSGNAEGINFLDDAAHTIQNNLVTNIQSTAGTAECYDNATVTAAVTAGNVSDDATSPQSGLRNAVIAFEDAANDIYWPGKGDTAGWGKGTDLGSGQIALDLLGRDRATAGDSWDAGAFQHALHEPHFIEAATEYTASATSLAITHGMTIDAGDVLVAIVTLSAAGTISSSGSVFTPEFQEESPVNASTQYGIFYRVATASEASSYTFTSDGAAGRISIHVMRFKNIDTSSIWDVAPSASTRAIKNAGTTLDTAKALTTLSDNAIGIGFIYTDDETRTYSGFTINGAEIYHGSGQAHYEKVREFGAAGSQTAFNATVSTTDDITAQYFALKAAAVPPIEEVGYAGAGSATPATAGSITHGIDIQDGDFIVALVHVNGGTNTISDNNGANSFTEIIADRDHVAASSTYSIFTRTAGASEPATYNFNGWASGEWSIVLGVFRNNSGWNIAPNTANEDSTAAATSLAIGSITPTVTDTFTLCFIGADSLPFSLDSVDNDFFLKAIDEVGRPAYLYGKQTPPASAVGTVTASWTGTNDLFGMLAALAPAVGGVVITDVDTDETWTDGDTALVVTGSGFM